MSDNTYQESTDLESNSEYKMTNITVDGMANILQDDRAIPLGANSTLDISNKDICMIIPTNVKV